jgi:hypothetical protein
MILFFPKKREVVHSTTEVQVQLMGLKTNQNGNKVAIMRDHACSLSLLTTWFSPLSPQIIVLVMYLLLSFDTLT